MDKILKTNLPIYRLVISENMDSNIEVDYVALVDKPAIEKSFLAFKEQKELHFEIQSEYQKIITGPLMLAYTPIYRSDANGEYYVLFDQDTVKQIALKFFKKGYQSNVNLMHDSGKTLTGLTMFESWIKDTTRGVQAMKGFEHVPDGSWFGSFKVENQDVWDMIKSGQVKGFSVEGIFNYEPLKFQQDDPSELLMRKVINILEQLGGDGSGCNGPNCGRPKGSGNSDGEKKNEVKANDKSVVELTSKAQKASESVQRMGAKYEQLLQGKASDVNLKTAESISRKATDELDGDVSQVKDAARNTVVIDKMDLGSAMKILQQDPSFSEEKGGRVKLQEGDKFYGYRGIVANFKADNGLTVEMQVNTPAMIYAKEKPENGRRLLGEQKYNEIKAKTKLDGGKGHLYYEEIRKIRSRIADGSATQNDKQEYNKLKSLSVQYYKNFYF